MPRNPSAGNLQREKFYLSCGCCPCTYYCYERAHVIMVLFMNGNHACATKLFQGGGKKHTLRLSTARLKGGSPMTEDAHPKICYRPSLGYRTDHTCPALDLLPFPVARSLVYLVCKRRRWILLQSLTMKTPFLCGSLVLSFSHFGLKNWIPLHHLTVHSSTS